MWIIQTERLKTFKHHYDGAWVQAELPAAVQENKPALSQAGCLRE